MQFKAANIPSEGRVVLQLLVIAFIATAGNMSQAQTNQIQSVHTMFGARTTGGSLVGITAGGQTVSGINRGGNGSMQNYAGFLAALVMRPDVDHDKDGICDEIDNDNDNDGIDDTTEILGTRFAPTVATDPNNPDSDRDGMSDGAECTAGTSPTNTASILAITDIRLEDGALRVFWTGGNSVRQVLMRRTRLMDPEEQWQPVFTNNPPTSTMMSVIDSEGTNTTSFYKVVIERL